MYITFQNEDPPLQMKILMYIDPGSGSYLVQMIIAAVLAVVFYLKSIWAKIKAFLFRNKKIDHDEDKS
jgi:hypothetical protein